MKGQGCTDALLTTSQHLKKSLDAGTESDIIQLDFSVAFDRVSHRGLLFKLKSIGVGGSVLSICREFLSNRRQRVVVDGATSEWIPIVSGVPQGSMLDPLLFILYASEMFELFGEQTIMSMLMTPLYLQLFASQQADLLLLPPLTETWLEFRIGAITGASYCIHYKTKALGVVDPGLSTLPMVTWYCLGFLFPLVPTLTFLA